LPDGKRSANERGQFALLFFGYRFRYLQGAPCLGKKHANDLEMECGAYPSGVSDDQFLAGVCTAVATLQYFKCTNLYIFQF